MSVIQFERPVDQQGPLLSVIRYREEEPMGNVSTRLPRTAAVVAATAAGVLLGFTALLISGHSQTVHTKAITTPEVGITQTVVPVNYAHEVEQKPAQIQETPASESASLEEIKTRNRRLEALVKVLRRRDLNERRQSGSSQRN